MFPALPLIASVAGPIVTPILEKAVGGLTQGLTQGGGLQSLLQPFNALFGQASSQLTAPFRATPALFQSPALSGTAGQLLGSLGDVAGKKASALEKLKSSDPIQQQQGLLELQEIQRAIDLVTQVAEMENESKKKIISKIS